jgi:riboflavin transporter FmnP
VKGKPSTRLVAGTAIMSALVVVFDYSLKFMGVKIPFPFFPTWRFDLDGVPIVIALMVYGPYSSFVTCAVAFVAILARSGQVVSASMKALAEFATILGMIPFYRVRSGRSRVVAMGSGVLSRALIMITANLAMWPLFFKSLESALVFVPFSALFNGIAGTISIFGGYLIYEAIARRAPNLMSNIDTE